MTDLPVEDASFGTDRLLFRLLRVLSPSPAYDCISVNHQKRLVQFGKMYGAKKEKKISLLNSLNNSFPTLVLHVFVSGKYLQCRRHRKTKTNSYQYTHTSFHAYVNPKKQEPVQNYRTPHYHISVPGREVILVFITYSSTTQLRVFFVLVLDLRCFR